ncbi:MAG: permease prefix domain 1-containing protein [Solirubrobacteraceae bacterium]
MNPIAEYLDELSRQLRRGRRARILAEVRAHLLDAAAADASRGIDPDRAARRAVERFGPPARVATQFNALRRRPRALIQRTAAVALAGAAMASLGTATVWAFEPGATPAHAHQVQHVQARHGGARR